MPISRAPGSPTRRTVTTTEVPSLPLKVARFSETRPAWSLSRIVKVALDCEPSLAPPVGVPSVISALRLPSRRALSIVGIEKVAVRWVGLNVKIPDVGLKSTFGNAVSAETLKSTVASALRFPVRLTVMTPVVPSTALKAGWESSITESSSTIVTTAEDGVPRVAPPWGSLSFTVKVSSSSGMSSWMIGMTTVTDDWLAPKTTRWETAP